MLKKFLAPSTLAYWKEARKRPDGSLRETLHGLFYLKWPELYIRVALGRGLAGRILQIPAVLLGLCLGLWGRKDGKSFADTYHGKVMTGSELGRLVRVNRALELSLPEKILPYSLARDIILENNAALALLDCPCRASMEKPCLPLDVCILVGQPIVDFMLEHHPAKCRRIGPEEAMAVIRAARKRGNVSHAFFKEAVLGRYYAICNCCSCCCGAMQAQRSGVNMLASSGYVALVDSQACIGCGLCATRCPFSAISMEKGAQAGDKPGDYGASSPAAPLISVEECMGCGVCVELCPKQALSLELEPSKPAPLQLAENKGEQYIESAY